MVTTAAGRGDAITKKNKKGEGEVMMGGGVVTAIFLCIGILVTRRCLFSSYSGKGFRGHSGWP
jgi:hypothetical protein